MRVAESGTTIPELLESICGAVSIQDASTLRRKIEGLLPEGELVGCDRVTAAQSLILIPAANVPKPIVQDPRILSVKWRVSLSGLSTSGNSTYRWDISLSVSDH